MFGKTELVELIPGGSDITVTEETKHGYVQLLSELKMTRAIRAQISSFLEGFHEFIPHSLIRFGFFLDQKKVFSLLLRSDNNFFFFFFFFIFLSFLFFCEHKTVCLTNMSWSCSSLACPRFPSMTGRPTLCTVESTLSSRRSSCGSGSLSRSFLRLVFVCLCAR